MLAFQIPAPAPDGAAVLRQETGMQVFRKEQFSFTRYYYEGQVTRQRFTTPALDELHATQVYNQYREKYKFMFPEQLIRMRERYGLTAARMALLLDIGPNQYSNYEAGEVPSASNARILRLASDPTTFLGIVRDKREELRPTEYEKLRRHIDTLLDAQTPRRITDLSVAPTVFVTETDPDQYTGYVLPSPEKFAELEAVMHLCRNLGYGSCSHLSQ